MIEEAIEESVLDQRERLIPLGNGIFIDPDMYLNRKKIEQTIREYLN